MSKTTEVIPLPKDPLSRDWLITRLASEVCANPRGSDRIKAIQLLEQIRNTGNPFSDDITIEERMKILKRLLTFDDIASVVEQFSDAEKQRLKKML